LRAAGLIAAVWTVSAQAADLPYGSRAPYTVNQPLNAYSWAGPYLGANLGYAWGSVDNTLTRPSGFEGGVQGGYNWQNGPWVFGVEADFQATGAEDTFAPWKFSNPWFGTVRGRVGYLLTPTLLLYGTGGFAYGGVTAFQRSNTSTGWTAGGGIEWQFAPHWSAKLEYLYVDLASSGIYGAYTGWELGNNHHPEINVVRLGVNYLFNFAPSAPVVAKY
jgi:outer membrane immunogenic protein